MDDHFIPLESTDSILYRKRIFRKKNKQKETTKVYI